MELKFKNNTIDYCCPVCNSNTWQQYLSCKDYLVSGEIFELIQCSNCDFIGTHNRPQENQISKYYQAEDYISHTDTQKGFINKLYHIARNWALKQKISIIKQHIDQNIENKKIKILDIGCGTGYFLNKANTQGWTTFGVEPDTNAAKLASKQNISAKIFSDLNEIEIADSFDAITMWHVLEHVYQLEKTLTTIYNKINFNGILMIAVPNPNSMDAQYYKSFWAAYDVPRHVSHFKPDTLQHLIEKFGFRLEKKYPMYLDAFYISMLSEKYKNKSNSVMGLLKAIVIGGLSNISAMQSINYSSVVYVFKKI